MASKQRIFSLSLPAIIDSAIKHDFDFRSFIKCRPKIRRRASFPIRLVRLLLHGSRLRADFSAAGQPRWSSNLAPAVSRDLATQVENSAAHGMMLELAADEKVYRGVVAHAQTSVHQRGPIAGENNCSTPLVAPKIQNRWKISKYHGIESFRSASTTMASPAKQECFLDTHGKFTNK